MTPKTHRILFSIGGSLAAFAVTGLPVLGVVYLFCQKVLPNTDLRREVFWTAVGVVLVLELFLITRTAIRAAKDPHWPR